MKDHHKQNKQSKNLHQCCNSQTTHHCKQETFRHTVSASSFSQTSPICVYCRPQGQCLFLPSLLRSPGPSVAIFELHAEWEERAEGGHRTGTRRGDKTGGWWRGGGKGGDQTGAEGAMCASGGSGGEVVTCSDRLRRPGSLLEGALALRQHCKQTGG